VKEQAQRASNVKLRQQREKRYWTQTELARMLGTTYLSVCRWENGTTSPSLYYRKQLCDLFHLSAEELGLSASFVETPENRQPPSAFSTTGITWSLPYRRNPFFTGREYLLARLHTLLNSSRATALSQVQALSGLGGIGKTQTAIEYAFRYRSTYQAVFWIRAENREVWHADLISLARHLKLLAQGEKDASYTLSAVTRWLETHTNWLLILDNVENFALIDELIPTDPHGHILLTTRAQSTGPLVQRLDVEQMSPEEGAFFLLRRAKLLGPDAPLEAASEATVRQANEICILLGGLPLALDQAGAYIEETGCSLPDYLELYQTQRTSLLRLRGQRSREHSESVSATVALCLEKVAQANPAAVELLRLCAFLDPDAIPEEIFTHGAPDLGPLLAPLATNALAFNTLFAALRTYSLIHRQPERKMLTIHRLVQAVVKDLVDESLQRQWAERCVRAVKRTFPEAGLPFCEASPRLIPQAQVCAMLVTRWRMTFLEAGQLLDLTGWYVMRQGQYQQAELLLQQGLQLIEENVGPEHPDFADCLEHLGDLYQHTDRLELARSVRQRVLETRERARDPEHPDVAAALIGLALTYRAQGRSDLAEPLFVRSYAIYERLASQAVLSRVHSHNMATCAENLGILSVEQGQFARAEPLITYAVALSEQLWGNNHHLTAHAYHSLGYLYEWQGQYSQAEKLYSQALAVREKTDTAHPNTAATLHHLARVYQKQAQYPQAETLFQRALTIRENALGLEHRSVGQTLSQMGSLYLDQKEDVRALPLITRALAIREKALGSDHPEVGRDLEALAQVYEIQGRYSEAEQCVQRALTIYESRLGSDHLESVESLIIAGSLSEKQHKDEEAAQFFQRALAICERLLGSEHPKTATSLHRLAALYARQGRTDEAQQIFQRARTICEQQLGRAHPETIALHKSYRELFPHSWNMQEDKGF
jgi:tetratricopeptide (TPR) repeat protein/transcriptional regulator with XRE-family HTH domain